MLLFVRHISTIGVGIAAMTLFQATVFSQVVVDGSLGSDPYGSALSLQNTVTQFGDAFTGDSVITGGGSEINGFYANIADGRLNVLVTGNLEENFNKMSFFFDTVGGGVNQLDGTMLPGGIDGFCCGGLNTTDGALQRQSGLRFDAGIEADFFLTFSNGPENALDDPNTPGNSIGFWAVSAHYSDLRANAPAEMQNVAAGFQLAPKGLPNVLREDGTQSLADYPWVPDGIVPTDPNRVGPALPNLGQGELIDRSYALGDGGCTDDSGAGCIATEIGFALDQSPTDPTNALSHRNFENRIDLQMALDNSNIFGVEGGDGTVTPTGDPSTVSTGLEFSIPLSALGNPSGDIRVVGFVNGAGHDYASNQFIGDGIQQGNLGGDGNGTYTGDLSGIDLSTLAGNQYVTIANSSNGPDGDFNDDGNWDCEDIDALVAEVVAATNAGSFDLNADGSVDEDDVAAWLVEGGAQNPDETGGNPFLPGDADLNGSVDGLDFFIWNDNKFDPVTRWCLGNFDANSAVDGQDFFIWNEFKFQTSSSNVVPEPCGLVLLICGGWFAALRRR